MAISKPRIGMLVTLSGDAEAVWQIVSRAPVKEAMGTGKWWLWPWNAKAAEQREDLRLDQQAAHPREMNLVNGAENELQDVEADH